MTYSPDHVADGQHLIELLNTLDRDVSELRRMVSIYDDAATMPARRQAGMDAGEGRQTACVSRPTEATALDGRRLDLQSELKNGAHWIPQAIAVIRGVTASMDRALTRWEGEDTDLGTQGEVRDHRDGTAGH